jgi:hypothetical protein
MSVPDASSDIEVFDPSTVQPSSDNEDSDYGSTGSDSDGDNNDERNSDSSEDEGSSRQAIRSNDHAWDSEVQNNNSAVTAVDTACSESETHSQLSSRATTPGVTSQNTSLLLSELEASGT